MRVLRALFNSDYTWSPRGYTFYATAGALCAYVHAADANNICMHIYTRTCTYVPRIEWEHFTQVHMYHVCASACPLLLGAVPPRPFCT